MAERQIEADEKPCPPTVGEWMGFLAAESHILHGYKHLAVTMLLMVGSITLAAYAATRFETFGPLMELIIIAGFCVVFVLSIYCIKRVMKILTEKDKNSEIIKEIIAGNLTDSDEIRGRWEDCEAPSNAGE